MGQLRPLFSLFSFFSNTNFTYKTESFSGIWTRIVKIDGEHADHLTTTTAQRTNKFSWDIVSVKLSYLNLSQLQFFQQKIEIEVTYKKIENDYGPIR